MAYIISADGGGSKLNALMVDENMNLVGRGLAGGVNLTQTSMEDCAANVNSCLDQLFASGTPDFVDEVYCTFVGPVQVLVEALEKRTRVGRLVAMGEAQGGLLAGNVSTVGMLALSGTGSDIFYIENDVRRAVGGWGPILGDDGSGAWIGQQALRAVVRQINGWGEETLLRELLAGEWKIKNITNMGELVNMIHGSAAPFRQVAAAAKLVGRAAGAGDKVAIGILKEAAHLLALQTMSLIRRENLSGNQLHATLCGGAWKTHPVMFEAYCAEMHQAYPAFHARRPLFEHVMAGPVKHLLDRNVPRDEVVRLLIDKLPQYRIDMSGEL